MNNKKQYNIFILIGFLLILLGISPLILESIIPNNTSSLTGQPWYSHLPLPIQYYFYLAYTLFVSLPITTIVTAIFIWKKLKLADGNKKSIIEIAGILLTVAIFVLSFLWWIVSSGAWLSDTALRFKTHHVRNIINISTHKHYLRLDYKKTFYIQEILGSYYGLDWLAMTGSLVFLLLIGSKKDMPSLSTQ